MANLRCSVLNCQKEVAEGEYVTISNRVFCIECGVLFNKMMISDIIKGG